MCARFLQAPDIGSWGSRSGEQAVKNIKWGMVVPAAAVVAGAVFGTIALSADASEPTPALRQTAATGAIPAAKGAVTNYYLGKGSVFGDNLGPGMVQWFTTVYDGSVHDRGLDASLKAKINSTTGKVKGLESDSPYPGATKLQDNPGNGANSVDKWIGDNGATLQTSWVQCADGKSAIGSGYDHGDEGAAAYKALQVVAVTMVQMKDGKEVYEPIKDDKAGSLVPNAVRVQGFNNGTADLIVRPTIVCADLG